MKTYQVIRRMDKSKGKDQKGRVELGFKEMGRP